MNLFWFCIICLCLNIAFLWWQIFKLKLILAGLLLEDSKELFESMMKEMRPIDDIEKN